MRDGFVAKSVDAMVSIASKRWKAFLSDAIGTIASTHFLTVLLAVLTFGAVIHSGFCTESTENAMTQYVVSGYRIGTTGVIQPSTIRTTSISPATVLLIGSATGTMTATVEDGYAIAAWQVFTSSPTMPGSTATLLKDSDGMLVTTPSIVLTADPNASTKYIVLVLSQTGGGTKMRVTPVGYRVGTSGDLTDFSSSVVTVSPSVDSTAPVTLTASLAKDYELVAWQKYVQDPRVRSTSPYETVTVTDGSKSLTVAKVADVAWMYVTAVVEYNPARKISARVSSFGKGTVTLSPEQDTYEPGDTVTLTAEPATGYAFVQWGDDAKATTHTRTVTVVDSKEYVAYIEPVSITVNFSVEDDATLDVTSKRVTYKSVYGALPTPTREGYAFTGWKVAGSTITADSVVNKTDDITATAVWSGGLTTLTFDANGGEGTVPTNMTVKVGEEVFLPDCTLTKTDCTTKGWVEGKDGTTVLTRYTPKKAGTVTFYAKYEGKKATLKFYKNGGEGTQIADKTVAVGETVTLPECLYTKTDCTTLGWALTADGDPLPTEAYNYKVERSGDIVFYARYKEADKATLKFDANGGSGTKIADMSVKVGDTVNLPLCTYAKTGYIAQGWGETPDGTDIMTTYTVTGKGEKTFYARYTKTEEPKTYTITFDNGSVFASGTMESQTIKENQSVTLTANAYERNGWSFNGWKDSSTGTTYKDKETVSNVKADMNLVAQWTQWTDERNLGTEHTAGLYCYQTTAGEWKWFIAKQWFHNTSENAASLFLEIPQAGEIKFYFEPPDMETPKGPIVKFNSEELQLKPEGYKYSYRAQKAGILEIRDPDGSQGENGDAIFKDVTWTPDNK